MAEPDLDHFEQRRGGDFNRPNEYRSAFQRDRARIIHSSSFRRLQGKTQVTGTDEGDFHRNRLTHSIEVSQIAYSLLTRIRTRRKENKEFLKGMAIKWLPDRDLIEAACLAHDLGHPPIGHAGERELFKLMRDNGGFEGNAQSLRILTKLDKYSDGNGVNPTRRLTLAILKYPVKFDQFKATWHQLRSPPKCYYSEDEDVVEWALEGLPKADIVRFHTTNDEGKAQFKTFDCSLMDLADDISNAVHDLEDLIARKMVNEKRIEKLVEKAHQPIINENTEEAIKKLCNNLLSDHSFERKKAIGDLASIFVEFVEVERVPKFQHPLLKYKVKLPDILEEVRNDLGGINEEHVVNTPQVQQLEHRGQYLVGRVFEKLLDDPPHLIPKWNLLNADGNTHRNVCDYVAGMTDDYLMKVYRRLFVPGYGSSTDEL